MFNRMILLLVFALFLSGCSSVATRAPRQAATEFPPSDASLFSSDSATLSDQEINQILNTRIGIPEGGVRIALLSLEHRSTDSHLGRYYRTGTTNRRRMIIGAVEDLEKIPGILDVSYLPGFLLPDQKTMGLVREAAARYQADWVLIYRTETRPDSKWRLLGPEEGRANCLAECALLDVRSGIIPFTSLATHQLTLRESDDDWSLEQTIERAEAQAVEAAMRENAENLSRFLESW